MKPAAGDFIFGLMLTRTRLTVILYLGILPGGLPAQGAQGKGPASTKTSTAPQKSGDEGLAPVLKQLEATGKMFKSFSANFAQKKYTAVLKEFDTPESGIFLYARAKDGSALLRQEVSSPAARILTIKGGSGDHLSAPAQAGARDTSGQEQR